MKFLYFTLNFTFLYGIILSGDKMKYDVIIIGAGPAGLFSAYAFITKNKKLKIALLDKGSSAEHRICPMHKKGHPCKNCNPCAILAG